MLKKLFSLDFCDYLKNFNLLLFIINNLLFLLYFNGVKNYKCVFGNV